MAEKVAEQVMRCEKTMCHHPKCADCYPQKANAASKTPVVRKFETGATRDTDDGKLDYEGFLSPRVLLRFAQYMHKNRYQRDGSIRDSDNWQKGIPLPAYMKSLYRHFMELWLHHRGVIVAGQDLLEEILCAIIFNAQGYLHEILKAKQQKAVEEVQGWRTGLPG
jgi:hypothetical protein